MEHASYLSYLNAQEILHSLAQANGPLEKEEVMIEHAVGRITTDHISSQECMPSFDNSAMDGFFIRAEDTIGATPNHPLVFKVNGCIAAGGPIVDLNKEPRSSVEIMTGAALPEKSSGNAVIKIEEVKVTRDAQGKATDIIISREVKKNENIRFMGEDFKIGQQILAGGQIIRAHHLLSLAGLGVSSVFVQRKMRVALIATGKELCAHTTQKLPYGSIRNSTMPYLMEQLKALGTEPQFYGLVKDDSSSFQMMLSRAMDEQVDLIVTTGAVSAGQYDFIVPALKDKQALIHFHRVAIRPGKPVLCAQLNAGQRVNQKGPVLLGMPGNPVSTAVGFYFFVAPFILTRQGFKHTQPLVARLSCGVDKKPEGLRCFYKGRIEYGADGQLSAQVFKEQSSSIVHSVAEANAWVILKEPKSAVLAGEYVDVVPFI